MIRFLFLRVMIFCAVLAVAAFFVAGGHREVPIGIMIGGFASVYKVRLFSLFLNYLVQNQEKVFFKSLLLNFFSLSIGLILLVVSVLVNVYLFYGVVIGLGSTVLVICFNGLTEMIGLTHNNWQDSKKNG